MMPNPSGNSDPFVPAVAIDGSGAEAFVSGIVAELIDTEMSDDEVTDLATATAAELPLHVALGLAFMAVHDIVRRKRDGLYVTEW